VELTLAFRGRQSGSVALLGGRMEKATLSHLFEPFFTTKPLGKGTGLGLAMVYGIVNQNRGLIHVDSEPGIGTTITIYLPRHVVEAGQAWTKRATQPAGRGYETILVVEDDPAVLEMTTRMLAGQGYAVLAARSPLEAIRLAGESAAEIHLLMTDVIMPVMNGREASAGNPFRPGRRVPSGKSARPSGRSMAVPNHEPVL